MMTLMMNPARSATTFSPENPQETVGVMAPVDLVSEAVCFSGNVSVSVEHLVLNPLQDGDLVVDVEWSGVSTGTERLLWSGNMPPFPGLSYPLVPGYESVGRVVHAEGESNLVGECVFVPGANCYENAAGLFGATASRVVIPEARAVRLGEQAQQSDVLLALAATAQHAINRSGLPELIIGHGVVGRLMARLVLALGGPAPTVWETNPARRDADDYSVIDPKDDKAGPYQRICDVSGSVDAIDTAISKSAKGAEITLAGFYADRVSFDFPLAFMREVSLNVAAEWDRADMDAVLTLRRKGLLSLDGLVTHVETADRVDEAYKTAFGAAECLKMVLDWRARHGHAS